MKDELKEQIAGSFSRYSASYDQYARLQKESAKYLSAIIAEAEQDLPEGPVLEIGCGSGMLSQLLAGLFAGKRSICYVDIAAGMLRQCRRRLQAAGFQQADLHFIEMDAEALAVRQKYAFIVSGLTMQWFRRLPATLAALAETLVPGGRLVFSFLGEGSFPEWARQCEKCGVDFTLNPLPAPEAVFQALEGKVAAIEHQQRHIELAYPKVKDFFQSLKKTGAGVNVAGNGLSAMQLRHLLSSWEKESRGEIRLTCKVNYFSILK